MKKSKKQIKAEADLAKARIAAKKAAAKRKPKPCKEHDFPPAEYQESGRIVRRSYACRVCGVEPGPAWFREQRGTPLSEAVRAIITSEMGATGCSDPISPVSSAETPSTRKAGAPAAKTAEGDGCSDPTTATKIPTTPVSASAAKPSGRGRPSARKPAKASRGGKRPPTATRISPSVNTLLSGPTRGKSIHTTPTSSPEGAAAKPAERPARPNGLAEALQKSAKPRDKHPPTEEQQAIIDTGRVMGPNDVLVIEAGAGTGKTTTLTMLEEVLKGSGQYTAFNSSLVAESGRKFRRAACNTTHSLAFRAVGNRYSHRLGGARIRSEQIARMLGIRDLQLGEGEQKKVLNAGFLAGQVTGAIRRFCQSADCEIEEGHFRYLDGIDMPGADGQRTYANNEKVREALLPFARKAWADLADVGGQLPFSHDCYVKIWQMNHPVIAADYILLDEAQDTAPVMLDILKQQKDALLILVGDSAQQIYEWRGAVDAMGAYPDAKRLYLSQSFRFGQAIADVANQILNEIGLPLRLKGLPSIPSRVAECPEPKAILCRTNAAAVARVLLAIGEGKRPFLVGGGSDVVAFVEGARKLQQGESTNHPELACFSSWGEVEEYSKLDEGEDLKLLVKLINSFGCDPILAALRSMPAEKDADLVVCTAHKSKGREWDSVALASDFPTLSRACESDLKLLYVAATRAKIQLDVSDCPFFTGRDALEVIPSRPPGLDEVLPPTPSAPVPQVFNWSKSRDGEWLIRGPKGAAGTTVRVVRRDGSSAEVKLGAVKAEYGEAAVYLKG